MPVFIASLEYEILKILLNLPLSTLCKLIVRGVIKKGEFVFYSKDKGWGCANKWDYKDHLIRGKLIVSGSRIHQSKSWRGLLLIQSNVLASHIIMGKHQ